MIQFEGTRMSREDRIELEKNIKDLENKIEAASEERIPLWDFDIKELRRLRRLRHEN